MKSAWLVVLTIVVFLCAWYTFDSQRRLGEHVVELHTRLSQLASEVTQLKLKSNIMWDKATENEPALLSGEESSYSIAKNEFGSFPIQLESAIPYLDGFKVKLAICNPTSIVFSGAKLDVSWGTTTKKEGATGNVFDDLIPAHTKQFDILNEFRAGAYSNVEIILTPAQPEHIRRITVGLALNQIRALKP